jgi:hypothetical protein
MKLFFPFGETRRPKPLPASFHSILELELTLFRGHLNLTEKGVHDAEIKAAIPD